MSSKLDFLHQKPSSPADHLRDNINALESGVVSLNRQPAEGIRQFLTTLDETASMLTMTNGPDLQSEQLRFDTVCHRVDGKAGTILRAIGGTQALQTVRPPQASPQQSPWWFLEQTVARQTANRRKKLGVVAAVMVSLFGILIILANTILKPDPLVVLKANNEDAAVQVVMDNHDYLTAMQKVDEVLALDPADTRFLALKGVLLQQMGNPDQAEAVFALAESSTITQTAFLHVLRGQYLWQFGQSQPALEQTQVALTINPQLAQAWFIAGQVYASQNDSAQAYHALSTAADLALQQGNYNLYTTARMNLAYLTSDPSNITPPDGTLTPD